MATSRRNPGAKPSSRHESAAAASAWCTPETGGRPSAEGGPEARGRAEAGGGREARGRAEAGSRREARGPAEAGSRREARGPAEAGSRREARSRPEAGRAAEPRGAAKARGKPADQDRPADRAAGELSPAATGSQPRRLPPVRLAPRDELAAAARVAPLLRAARDLARWAGRAADSATTDPVGEDGGALRPEAAAAAAADLDLAPAEVDAAWAVAVATRMLGSEPAQHGPKHRGGVLASGDTEQVLAIWDAALETTLAAEDLDGLATALYTVGRPVRMEGLFDAYAAAAGTRRSQAGSAEPDQAAALSAALETLADLGVVEPGTEESAGGLTVALSPLGVWGVHRRLRAQGWHAPVLGGAGRSGAAGLLIALASCDAEDGEAEITAWLAERPPAQAAAELVEAAGSGSPGLRGAAFAVLDRIGEAATDEVRAALADPVLRAHASVWLHEHGEPAELRPEDRTWLLVDLGAGLLEEADPSDVVAELLPDVPAEAQAEIVAGLWQVDHPGVTDLLTALSEHHPDPAVARAARKAAFKARSPSAVRRRPAP